MATIGTSDVVSITEPAAKRIRVMAEREGRTEACLRLRVTAGGCSGFSYNLSLEDEPAADDLVVEGYGARVVIDPRSAPIVEGSIVDFSDAMLGGGMKVRNPNATSECACGESFSV